MKKLNELITEARKKNKISRKGIEHISGFNERTIGAYERGELTIPDKYLSFIFIYFNIKKECFEKGIITEIEYLNGYEKYKKKDNTIDRCNMNEKRLVIERYKAIHNLTTDELILKIGINKSSSEYFETYFDYDQISTSLYGDKKISDLGYYALICKQLKIKPSSFGFCLSWNGLCMEHKEIETYSTYLTYKTISDEEKEKYKIYTSQEEKDKKELLEYENDKEFILYDEKYYLSVIKARNNPKNVYIPTQKEAIPDKYKEILELLPYASDSFTQNLRNKLLELKKAQQIEDL